METVAVFLVEMELDGEAEFFSYQAAIIFEKRGGHGGCGVNGSDADAVRMAGVAWWRNVVALPAACGLFLLDSFPDGERFDRLGIFFVWLHERVGPIKLA